MNQAQSESLLSLFMLGILGDKKLTLKEGDALNLAAKCLEWHSYKPKELFVLATFRQARKASQTEETTQAYLREKITVFKDAESQEYLLKTLHTILACDGYVPCEVRFMDTLKAALTV